MDNNTMTQQQETQSPETQPQTPPALEAKPKFPKAAIFIIGAILILCAIAVTLVFAFTGSPKTTVMQAISKTFTTKDSTLEEYIPAESFRELMATGNIHTNMTLNLDDLKLGDSTAEMESIVTLAPRITVDSMMNYNDKKLLSSVDIGMGGSNVFNYKAYANDTIIAMECPMLYDGALSINSATLSNDYNGSALSSMMGTPALDDTMNFDLFEGELTDQTFLDLYKTTYAEDLDALYESITVEKADGMEIQLGDQTVKAKGYQLSLPTESLKLAYKNAFTLLAEQSQASYEELSTTMEEQLDAATFPEVFQCTVYVDPSSKEMIRFVHNADYTFDGVPLHMDLNIDWTDTTAPMDHMMIDLTCTTQDQQESTITFAINGTQNEGTYQKEYVITTDTTDMESTYDPMTLSISYEISPDNDTFSVSSYLEELNQNAHFYDLSATGSFADISTSENISMNFDSITLAIPSEDFQVELSGDYTLSSYDGEIASPESLRPILEMDEDGLTALMYEVISNVSNSSMFGSLLQ